MVNYPSFGVWFVGVDIPKELIKLLEVVDNSKWRQRNKDGESRSCQINIFCHSRL